MDSKYITKFLSKAEIDELYFNTPVYRRVCWYCLIFIFLPVFAIIIGLTGNVYARRGENGLKSTDGFGRFIMVFSSCLWSLILADDILRLI